MSLLDAVIWAESRGNPSAISPKGAVGLTQIMPATARDPGFGLPNIFDLGRDMGRTVPDTSEETLRKLLLDADVNKAFGANYLGAMSKRYGGDQAKTLAAYNAGPGAVDEHGGVPPYAETMKYVSSIANRLSNQRAEKPVGLSINAVVPQREEQPQTNRAARQPFEYEPEGTWKPALGRAAEIMTALSQGRPARTGQYDAQIQQTETKNKTVSYLVKNGREDLARAIATGAMTPQEAMGVLHQPAQQVKGQSAAGQIMADLQKGLITREQADAAMKKALSNKGGASLRVSPDGTVEWLENGAIQAPTGDPQTLARRLSGEDAKTIAKIRDNADSTSLMGLLNAASAILDNGYETGALAGVTGEVDRWAAAFGVTDGAEAEQYEQLTAVSKQVAMEGLRLLGGNDTERELLTSMQTTVRPQNRPETNRKILQRQMAAAQIVSERADFYADWAVSNNGLSGKSEGQGVEAAWRAYQRKRWDEMTKDEDQTDLDVEDLLEKYGG